MKTTLLCLLLTGCSTFPVGRAFDKQGNRTQAPWVTKPSPKTLTAIARGLAEIDAATK